MVTKGNITIFKVKVVYPVNINIDNLLSTILFNELSQYLPVYKIKESAWLVVKRYNKRERTNYLKEHSFQSGDLTGQILKRIEIG